MTDLYFDDFVVGQQVVSPGATITESMIIDFALLYDPQPIHIDGVAAAQGPFQGLIASGFQTFALSFRLFMASNLLKACSLGGPGMDELRWLKPVRPGDTIHVESRFAELRPSRSRADRGTGLIDHATINQTGETVMTVRSIHLLARRPGERLETSSAE